MITASGNILDKVGKSTNVEATNVETPDFRANDAVAASGSSDDGASAKANEGVIMELLSPLDPIAHEVAPPVLEKSSLPVAIDANNVAEINEPPATTATADIVAQAANLVAPITEGAEADLDPFDQQTQVMASLSPEAAAALEQQIKEAAAVEPSPLPSIPPELMGTSSLADILGLKEEMADLPELQKLESSSKRGGNVNMPTALPDFAAADKDADRNRGSKAVKLPPETEERKKARHTARGLVSQLFANNRRLVQDSLRKGSFYELMKEQITTARREYEKQVSKQVRDDFDYFQLELDVRIQAMKKEI
jgi:hypothetical protein